jgi:hypothetical protein
MLSLLSNLWWEYNLIFSVPGNVRSISSSGQISGIELMFKQLMWPNQLFVITSIYPTVYSAIGNNAWSWIEIYGNSFLTPLFLSIAIILMFFTYMPLLSIRNGNALLLTKTKIRLYVSIMILTFFLLLGQNPLMGYIYDFISTHLTYLLPYLYAIGYPFSEMLMVFFIAVLLPNSIYEFIHGNYNFWQHKHIGLRRFNKSKFRKIVAVITVILIIVIYPWYLYTPQATQQYNTGHGQPITSVVKIPAYFLNATKYISDNAGSSGTLILPESYDFLSMNFSSNNSFANDQNPSYLTGTQIIFGSNTINEIQRLLYNNGIVPDNLSIFLNTLNIKYIFINTIERNSVLGYLYYNLSYLFNYLNNQPGIKEIKQFGPIKIYENIYYNGIIQALKPSYFSPTLKNPVGYESVLKNNTNLTQIGNIQSASYVYSNDIINFAVSKFNKSQNVLRYVNTAPFNVNISSYHYVIITLQTTTNMCFNLRAKTFFSLQSPSKIGSTLLSTMNYTLYNNSNSMQIGNLGMSQSGINYTTFVYPLYGQSFDPSFSNYLQNNSSFPTFNNSEILNHLIFIFSLKPSNASYYANISQISFAKYISQNDMEMQLSLNESMSEGLISNSSVYTPRNNSVIPAISYQDINPTKYTVTIKNANSPYLLMLKQNFNPNWIVETNSGKILKLNHISADGYANSWIINITGNYTLQVIYAPQKTYEYIEYLSAASNLIMISVIPIIYWRRH